jgi:hypothetical protein
MGRMGPHQWGYPQWRSRAAGRRHQPAGQRVEEAIEVAGEQRGADAKLTAVTVGPEGGWRRLTTVRHVRLRKRTARDVRSAPSGGQLGSRSPPVDVDTEVHEEAVEAQGGGSQGTATQSTVVDRA